MPPRPPKVTVETTLDTRDIVRLPEDQWRRMQRMRDQMLDDLVKAADELGTALDGDLRRAARYIKNHGYKPHVIEQECKALARLHHNRLGKALAGQLELAATMATRYEEMIEAFANQRIRRAMPRLLTDYATEHLMRQGGQQVRTALSTEVLLSQGSVPAPTRFAADRVLKRHVKPWKQAREISAKLHGRAARAGEEITSQVLAATREARLLSNASTELIRSVHKSGQGAIAATEKQSKLMKRVEKAGSALNHRGGDAALKEWQVVRKQLRTYMRRLATDGKARSSLLELLQQTSDTSAKGITRAIQQHGSFKQKYAAERILKTEQMAAFKSRQVLSDQKHDWIVGYIWRMNRAARTDYVKRTAGKKGQLVGGKRYRSGGKGRRRRCVCEELDGKRLSKEAVGGKVGTGGSARLMAHPHCMCWLEPVMDQRRLAAPISDEELADLD